MKKSTRTALGGASLAAMLTAATLGAGPALAGGSSRGVGPTSGSEETVALRANLRPLNRSGAHGKATAVVQDQLIRQIDVHVAGLSPNAPHAQHIHYGDDARNECPSVGRDDENGDAIIDTIEGLPAYGPIVVSLTTSGGTTPADALAVKRFPVSSNGSYSYSRRNIEFTAVNGTGYTGGNGTAEQIADSVREGEGVVVIHGVDQNGNGFYDGPASTLAPHLPQEATLPAACGLLR